MTEPLLTRYMQPLMAGRRAECFNLIADAVSNGSSAESLLCDVVWPALGQIERLYCDNRIEAVVDNMACRINRTVAGRLQACLPAQTPCGKRIVISCAADQREELRAGILADLFLSAGWDVYFVGSNVPHDEVLSLVGQLRPQVLLTYGAQPSEVPEVRRLFSTIREIGVCPTMNIVVSGGVFDRADGLWREVGADEYIADTRELVSRAAELEPRKPGPVRLGIVKKRRRRRKATAPASTAGSRAPAPAVACAF